MKKYGIKTLYGIIGIGIILCIIHIMNDKGGSAFGNIIETLGFTSLILFFATLILLVSDFKENIRKFNIWFLLIISFPFSFQIIKNFGNEYYLKMVETTTPKEFTYSSKNNYENYRKDKVKLEKLVDSLLKIKIIEKPSELTLRYFNGKNYNDSIERDWAIDLPMKIQYKESIIDTLFYSENGKEIIAGLLVNKTFNEHSKKIEYIGKGFEFKENDWKPFKMLKYSVSGHKNYKSCSERLRYYYLKKIGTYENEYNMNDLRFLNGTE